MVELTVTFRCKVDVGALIRAALIILSLLG